MKKNREEAWMSLLYAFSTAWIMHWVAQTATARVFAHFGRPELMNYFSGGESLAEEGMDAIRVSIAAVQLLAFGLPGAVFLVVYFGRMALSDALRPRASASVLVAMVLVVVAQPMIQFTVLSPETFSLPWSEWERDLERVEARNAQLLEGLLPRAPAWNLVVIAALPAVMEEVFFRGFVLKTLFTVTGRHTAVWMSALLFSLMHFQAFGFVGRTLLGAMFGYFTVLASGNLWPAIAAHFVNNGMYVMLAYFFSPRQAQESSHWMMALVSTLLVGVLFALWARKSNSMQDCVRP
jgi:membrane protease YdiL (CAAX protease family)